MPALHKSEYRAHVALNVDNNEEESGKFIPEEDENIYVHKLRARSMHGCETFFHH